MASEGELRGFSGVTCDHDGQGRATKLELQVLRSAAGYYLGYFCPQCGPYSRETGYMTKEQAEAELAKIKAGSTTNTARDTEKHSGGFEVTVYEDIDDLIDDVGRGEN